MKKYIVPVVALFFVIIVAGVYSFNQWQFPKERQESTTMPSQQSLSPRETKGEAGCSGKEIPSLTEGPYYKAGSPERTTIREDDTPGIKLTLEGVVYDTKCEPIPNAWLDFWQADGDGNYDNDGFNLRGQQRTDSNGKYRLVTVIPAEYPGRTEHIHVKIRATENSPVITSQLFSQTVLGMPLIQFLTSL